MNIPQYIIDILRKRLDGATLTGEEQKLVEEWFTTSEAWQEDILLYQQFKTSDEKNDQALKRFMTSAGFKDETNDREVVLPAPRVHFLKTMWARYAAAIIIILLGLSVYLWNNNKPDTIVQAQNLPVKNDILPGSDKAILTLADGKQVTLDSTANLLLAQKGISNSGALISYSNKGKESVINTLATPKGGQYRIKLGDGTMVWLNAASSITYPTIFTGKNREVNITGEVYFEVVKDKEKPFVVHTIEETITVLGTSFNVNHYSDEPTGKVSLVDGSVKVGTTILQPGQAYLNGKVILTNIEQDVAWKNGLFNFEGADLRSVLRQLERWYDITVRYEGWIKPGKFKGKLHRDLTLLQIMEVLQEMGIKSRLEGKTLFVE